jgi:hypothetical protein
VTQRLHGNSGGLIFLFLGGSVDFPHSPRVVIFLVMHVVGSLSDVTPILRDILSLSSMSQGLITS